MRPPAPPPARSSPSITSADPTSSTTAVVVLNAPSTGVVQLYTVTACPKGTTAPDPRCRSTTCTSINCVFDGSTPAKTLQPGTEYVVTATATMDDNSVRPASNSLPLVMPAANAPTLIEAQATGPSSAGTLAKPPPNARYLSVSPGAC